MEKEIRIYFLVMIFTSVAEGGIKNLAGEAGKSITFPDAVTEKGFLLYGIKTVSMVDNKKNLILEDIYKDKLHWNEDTGLFSITDLQRQHSGIYSVDSKKEHVFTASYNLTVYDPAPTPAVTPVDVTSDLCLLTCSVDKPATLLWIRDQEIQNQNRSALSLHITVYKQDRNSSYRCAAANPAENKTVDVDVTILCGFNETESGNNNQLKYYWKIYTISIKITAFVALTAAIIRVMHLKNKASKCVSRKRLQ
ncbi:uncharacterized protein LOC103131380 isoform X2 [Poecilia formosa]|uniref:uncharacterized protein LOC103131380 isoform X2 n=1 Tax=Poecilia formosa TaxID=48698 RepID=UPI00044490BD|nr:PREDICTED: uncharacterized protein LOC103131380 isoform X2 [Poecilia formosa]